MNLLSCYDGRRFKRGCPAISLRGGTVPRSLVSQRVKVPPAPFTRIGAEANSGRVSPVRGNLKSLRRSSARSKSEPEVGYANDDPPPSRGSSMPLWGWFTVCKCGPKRDITIGG